MLISVIRACGRHQERRCGERRKSEVRTRDVSGVRPILTGSGKRDRASRSAEGHRVEGRQRRKLLVWDRAGRCHVGGAPYVVDTVMFVGSIWTAPISSDVIISLVPEAEGLVGQEPVWGSVLYHLSAR